MIQGLSTSTPARQIEGTKLPEQPQRARRRARSTITRCVGNRFESPTLFAPPRPALQKFPQVAMSTEWRPADESPFQPQSLPPPPPRRKRRRGPSLLEMIKEEELKTEMETAVLAPQKPRKRRKKANPSKRSALLKTAKKFTKRALEKTTLAWHKTCECQDSRTPGSSALCFPGSATGPWRKARLHRPSRSPTTT